jgi:hypothetical protein
MTSLSRMTWMRVFWFSVLATSLRGLNLGSNLTWARFFRRLDISYSVVKFRYYSRNSSIA